HIYFEVHGVAGLERLQIGHLGGVRNYCNRYLRSFDFCDREADAFDGEGAFEDDVAGKLWRNLDAQPIVIGAGDLAECDEFAGAVDVALDDVSAETSVGAHGEFQIDQRTWFNPGERS